MPASKFRYGSIYTQETFWFESCKSLEIEEVTTPFPRPDITPPVTKMNFVCIDV